MESTFPFYFLPKRLRISSRNIGIVRKSKRYSDFPIIPVNSRLQSAIFLKVFQIFQNSLERKGQFHLVPHRKKKKRFFIQINKCKFNTYNKREILERFSHHSYAAWSPLTFKIFIKRVFNPSFHYARFPWTCKRCKHIHDTKYDQISEKLFLKKSGLKQRGFEEI